MQEPNGRHRNLRTHEAPADTSLPLPPRGRTVTRIYERQRDFQRDLRYRERQGWKLVNTRHQRANFPLDQVRASAPGSLLRHADTRIVAYYTCVAPEISRWRATLLVSAMSHLSYQTRLATSAWLTRLAHSIQPPCQPE